MIVAAGFVIGCAFGWVRAARRGGGTADRVQYALAHGIPAGLLTLTAVILAANFGWL